MPLLRTTEKIFIGYSLPQLEHKDTAERVIADINAANRHRHIQLYVCEYRQLVIDAVPLQRGIDSVIEQSDLVILLFGTNVGVGLAWETQHTLELFKKGRIYKLLPYVIDDSAVARVSASGPGMTHAKDVEHFYESESITYYKIERPEMFEDRLRQHIEVWLAEEERIVERQRDFLRRGLLRHFAIEDVAFGDSILAIQERDKHNLAANSDTEAAYRTYVEAGDGDALREEPIDYYLIARHLRHAILRNTPEVASKVEFINPIHQFLATLLRQDDLPTRATIIATLDQWLKAKSRLSERARNFAAFQLGMLQAREAANTLLDTARNHGELRSVRHYAIYALGMLRQRSMIVPLMDVHATETDPVLRDALTNSILFMMGVTE